METIDPISLEILWNRLISIVNEQATALQNASFTTVVREAGDLSAGVFDTRGNMIAQAVTGTPGHINTMALAVRHFLSHYPWQQLEDGDSLISNDPWLTSGHLNDFTVVTPIFRHGRRSPCSPTPVTRSMSAAGCWAPTPARCLKRAFMSRS